EEWKIPTMKDWQTLKKNCLWVYTNHYGKRNSKGFLVYKVKREEDKGKEIYPSKYDEIEGYTEKDPHIFLPSTGDRVSGSLDLRDDTMGYYWSSEKDSLYENTGRSFNFNDRGIFPNACSTRYLGRCVRPIRNSPEEKSLFLEKRVDELTKRNSTLEDELEKKEQEILSLRKENSAMQKVIQELKKEFEQIKISIPTQRCTGTTNGHEWVQLWEGGPKFATCNIGASKPWGYGDYYRWGETYDQRSGKGKGILPSDSDIATISWGKEWRMPTMSEFQALLENCGEGEWVEYYKGSGIKGRLFRGVGDGFTEQELFFPVAGYCSNGGFGNVGSSGYYWSSVPRGSNSAWVLYSCSDDAYMFSCSRYYGQSVRAVCAKN
ncbi:MAG TPA: hypothetical protein DDY68_06380, partial [Porphyromonadaceae bacterium]|nr:hypothetical protein [Porphyromonadaceae bacterium]